MAQQRQPSISTRRAFAYRAGFVLSVWVMGPPAHAQVRPANDNCLTAHVVAGTPFSDSIDTVNATTPRTDPVPVCGRGRSFNSAWYRLTPQQNAWVTANTFGSTYDTVLSVYTGVCGELSPVMEACNDDAFGSSEKTATSGGGGKQSQISFFASPGTTYFLMVSAYQGDGGELLFNVDDPPGGIMLEACTLNPSARHNRRTGLLPLAAALPVILGARLFVRWSPFFGQVGKLKSLRRSEEEERWRSANSTVGNSRRRWCCRL